jgi:hypothetical protein
VCALRAEVSSVSVFHAVIIPSRIHPIPYSVSKVLSIKTNETKSEAKDPQPTKFDVQSGPMRSVRPANTCRGVRARGFLILRNVRHPWQ